MGKFHNVYNKPHCCVDFEEAFPTVNLRGNYLGKEICERDIDAMDRWPEEEPLKVNLRIAKEDWVLGNFVGTR